MKKQPLLWILLTLLGFGLITACSKNNSTPTPSNPLVGEFDITRIEYTGFPTSYSVYNSVVTSTTALGTDMYIFKDDNTFTNTYTVSNGTGKTSLNTQAGGYAYVAATQTVTLTATVQNGNAPQPYALLYSSAASELSTGLVASQDSIPNPATGVKQFVRYSANYVYKKK